MLADPGEQHKEEQLHKSSPQQDHPNVAVSGHYRAMEKAECQTSDEGRDNHLVKDKDESIKDIRSVKNP